jgi:RimJ/RimL family protein N-acetyltransferase
MDFIIREARPDDAEQMIAFVKRIADEPGISIVLQDGEFTMTVEQERQFIADRQVEDNSLFLVAEAGGEIIGTLTLRGGGRRAIHHEAVLGISVKKEWRGQGVGNALMASAVDRAKRSGVITRIELQVFTSNPAAIHLYRKHGFEIEGCRHRAVFRDGRYHDDYVMALLL